MRESINKYIEELENRSIFLENKLNFVLQTIKLLNEGSYDKAHKSLNSYKNSSEYILLETLINKIELSPFQTPHEEDKSHEFLTTVLNKVPFPVFIKDHRGKYLAINELEEKLFNIKKEEIIGKRDEDFVLDKEELRIIKESDEKVLSENKSVELPNQSFSLKNGRSYVFKTFKIPFTNPITKKTNLLGYSLDVTDTVNLEKLKKILIINSPYL